MLEVTVSLVSYASDPERLQKTLLTLQTALTALGACARQVCLIDNGPTEADRVLLQQLGDQTLDHFVLLSGHGNIGFGRGHNLAIEQYPAQLHLILNPDVELAPDCLVQARRHMREGVVLLAPQVCDSTGALCSHHRRYPTVLDLGLRGFAPHSLRRRFERRLAHFEYRDCPLDQPMEGFTLASGCFMVLDGAALRAAQGFDPSFFLYFEDYDLSIRLARYGRLCYRPDVQIVHYGGRAARKGVLHIALFMRSAARFYRKHGWKWI